MYNSLDTVYKQNRHFENKSALSEERNPNFLWQQHLLIDYIRLFHSPSSVLTQFSHADVHARRFTGSSWHEIIFLSYFPQGLFKKNKPEVWRWLKR